VKKAVELERLAKRQEVFECKVVMVTRAIERQRIKGELKM
jgi:hypothetical protein